MTGFVWKTGRCMMLAAGVLACGGSISAPSLALAGEADLRPVVAAMVEDAILPAYKNFLALAELEVRAIDALCKDPGQGTLERARYGFSDLVDGFSRIEALPFGPAREENRFERLFFWPDRRSRGLRQVEGIILENDPSALNADTLAEKSVAVQGLLALDFVLSDDEAGSALLEVGGFRCGYALAISRRIAGTAKELLADWSGPTGYGNSLKDAASDQPIYRSGGEAMQELLRAAAEMLTIDREFKIARVIGETPSEAKLKRAPFWRSKRWLQAVDGNLAFVETLFAGGMLESKLDEENKSLPTELRFELEQARKALRKAADLAEYGSENETLGKEAHGLLTYAMVPIHGAADILESRLPEALGLVIGFNSLDGD